MPNTTHDEQHFCKASHASHVSPFHTLWPTIVISWMSAIRKWTECHLHLWVAIHVHTSISWTKCTTPQNYNIDLWTSWPWRWSKCKLLWHGAGPPADGPASNLARHELIASDRLIGFVFSSQWDSIRWSWNIDKTMWCLNEELSLGKATDSWGRSRSYADTSQLSFPATECLHTPSGSSQRRCEHHQSRQSMLE